MGVYYSSPVGCALVRRNWTLRHVLGGRIWNIRGAPPTEARVIIPGQLPRRSTMASPSPSRDPDAESAHGPTPAQSRPSPRSQASGTARLVSAGSPAWRSALGAVDHDVYHLPEYTSLDARGVDGTPVAYIYSDHEHVLLIPLVVRAIPGTSQRDATSSYGYPGPISTCPAGADHPFWREAVAAFGPTLAAEGIVSCFVRLHPLLPARLDALQAHGAVVEHGSTVGVDLTLPAEALWRGIRANHRRQITSAMRNGLRVDFDAWSDLSEFIDAYHENMRYVDADPSYFFGLEYFHALRSELGGAAHLVTATHHGDMIAGALVFECGGIVQYHLGATRTRHRDKQPLKAVIHQVIEWAGRRDNRVLHLGGGLGGRADSLFHFKAGFSALSYPFHTWRVIADPESYETLTAQGPALAGDRDPLFFPAYRRTR